jgi:hypothetical protein
MNETGTLKVTRLPGFTSAGSFSLARATGELPISLSAMAE